MKNSINTKKGFTLLELLIVVAIIVILAGIVFVVLNPAETLRKTRDSQRISDLNTIKSAVSLYLTTITNPFLGAASANATCRDTEAAAWTATDRIYYSLPSSTDITDTSLDAVGPLDTSVQVAQASLGLVDGNGWIPVILTGIIGGSPLSNWPIDPSNDITFGGSAVGAVTNTALVYRYACQADNLTFELNANLESTAYTSGSDNKEQNDGGNNNNLLEVGTTLKVLTCATAGQEC